MVSLKMDAQKNDKEELATPDPPKSTRTTKVLWFYCGGVTTALVVLAILGGLYYQDVRDMCQTVGSQLSELRTRRLSSNDKSTDGDGEVEVTRDTEIYYMRGANASQSGVIVADFKQNVVGVYLKEADRCFLAKHLDDKLPSPEQVQSMIDEGLDIDDDDADKEIRYEQDSNQEVPSRYQVPLELHAMCWDKPINWLKEVDEESDTVSRQKRFLYCYYRCYTIWGRRWCFRYCINIGK